MSYIPAKWRCGVVAQIEKSELSSNSNLFRYIHLQCSWERSESVFFLPTIGKYPEIMSVATGLEGWVENLQSWYKSSNQLAIGQAVRLNIQPMRQGSIHQEWEDPVFVFGSGSKFWIISLQIKKRSAATKAVVLQTVSENSMGWTCEQVLKMGSKRKMNNWNQKGRV